MTGSFDQPETFDPLSDIKRTTSTNGLVLFIPLAALTDSSSRASSPALALRSRNCSASFLPARSWPRFTEHEPGSWMATRFVS